LGQPLLHETQRKEETSENKSLVVGQEQLLMLSTGELSGPLNINLPTSVIAWNNERTTNRITSIEESSEPILHYISAHGRSIYCSSSTLFMQWPVGTKEKTSAHQIQMYGEDFSGSPREINMSVIKYLPVFGEKKYSRMYLDSLGTSLTRTQNLRPNQYIHQKIPALLADLDKESLEYVMDTYILPLKVIKHLTPRSKDIMIALLSKLSIDFDGQVPGHKATKGCGTIKLKGTSSTVSSKKESIRFVKRTDQKAYKIFFEENKPIIINGIITCLVN